MTKLKKYVYLICENNKYHKVNIDDVQYFFDNILFFENDSRIVVDIKCEITKQEYIKYKITNLLNNG